MKIALIASLLSAVSAILASDNVVVLTPDTMDDVLGSGKPTLVKVDLSPLFNPLVLRSMGKQTSWVVNNISVVTVKS